MNFSFKKGDYHSSPLLKLVQIFLLLLIVIGIALLVTQKTWVPKIVGYILRNETQQGVNGTEAIDVAKSDEQSFVTERSGQCEQNPCTIPSIDISIETSGLGLLTYHLELNETQAVAMVAFSSKELELFENEKKWCDPKSGPLGSIVKLNKTQLQEEFERSKATLSEANIYWLSNFNALSEGAKNPDSGIFERDNYFFVYVGPQSTCTDDSTGLELQSKLVKGLKRSFINSMTNI